MLGLRSQQIFMQAYSLHLRVCCQIIEDTDISLPDAASINERRETCEM